MAKDEMAKGKGSADTGSVCGQCNKCTWIGIILGIVVVVLSWMYVTQAWAKWILIIIGVLWIIKKWIPHF